MAARRMRRSHHMRTLGRATKTVRSYAAAAMFQAKRSYTEEPRNRTVTTPARIRGRFIAYGVTSTRLQGEKWRIGRMNHMVLGVRWRHHVHTAEKRKVVANWRQCPVGGGWRFRKRGAEPIRRLYQQATMASGHNANRVVNGNVHNTSESPPSHRLPSPPTTVHSNNEHRRPSGTSPGGGGGRNGSPRSGWSPTDVEWEQTVVKIVAVSRLCAATGGVEQWATAVRVRGSSGVCNAWGVVGRRVGYGRCGARYAVVGQAGQSRLLVVTCPHVINSQNI